MRTSKKIIALAIFCMSAAHGMAQVDDGWMPGLDDGWIDQTDYRTFRQEAERRYHAFRDSANARYARALSGQWRLMTTHPTDRAPKRPDPPAPIIVPGVEIPQNLPVEPVVVAPVVESVPLPADTTAPSVPPAIDSVASPRKERPPVEPLDVRNLTRRVEFPFYGGQLTALYPSALDTLHLLGESEEAVGRFWQQLTDAAFYNSVAVLFEVSKRMRLSTWGYFMLTRRFCERLFPGDANSQVVATAFLLANSGYLEPMLCRTDRGLAWLFPMAETIYNTIYITTATDQLRGSGINHYLFMPDNSQGDYRGEIYAIDLSSIASVDGLTVSLVSEYGEAPLLFKDTTTTPYQHLEYQSTNSGTKTIRLTVPVNKNLMDYYNDMPLTDLEVYASAPVSKEVDKALCDFWLPFVREQDTATALQTLLTFVQYGFEYKNDSAQFGREKFFFCEENFFYPYNDCDDRATLFSYLVRRLLGLDVLLVLYDNHATTAVCLPYAEPTGQYFSYKGRKYVVCDPTYIGASVGQSMPEYINKTARLKELPRIAVAR